ncbi:DUF6230 family protein [Streptomyces sp. CA-106110]|uniref:DUF6230 family protein n=1 Tax=Streptomyces sp. CA-106110 TaxID=3240044 RepID=UPI003D925A7E
MPGTRGRIRWKLFAFVTLPSLTAGAALSVDMAKGVLAASYLISSEKSKSSSERIKGEGLISYTAYDRVYEGKIVPVLVSGLKESKTMGLCQSTVVRDFPLIGTFTVKLTAAQVVARDTYNDVIQSSSSSYTLRKSVTGIAVGASRNGPGVRAGDKTNPASRADEADSILVTNSKQIVVATSADIVTTSGSRVRFYRGINLDSSEG